MIIVNWNTQGDRATPKSKKFPKVKRIISEFDPDIICLTEAYPKAMPSDEPIICSGLSGWGWPEGCGARKVVLWSRSGWSGSDDVGSPKLPKGRFVSGNTLANGVNFSIVGMCIPYASYSGFGITAMIPESALFRIHKKF